MKREIAQILREDDGFLVVTHVNPDGDAIGSMLGMTNALKEMGKSAWAFAGGDLPGQFDFLPGFSSVLVQGKSLPEQPKWIIALDAAEIDRIFGEIKPFIPPARIINIDHHKTNPLFGDFNLVDPDASSTAELVFRLVQEAGRKPSINVAKCLYTGLVTDTGCFRYSGVTAQTLCVGADLLSCGLRSYDVTRALYEENSYTRTQLERVMLDRMELKLDGRLCLSVLLESDFTSLGAGQSETENLVDRLREIRGVEVGALITEVSHEITRVSFRSKGGVDVALLAKSFGGGGHRSAAGLRTSDPPHVIKDKIITSVNSVLNK
jgi:phosphoesterase RecJ-like protein